MDGGGDKVGGGVGGLREGKLWLMCKLGKKLKEKRKEIVIFSVPLWEFLDSLKFNDKASIGL